MAFQVIIAIIVVIIGFIIAKLHNKKSLFCNTVGVHRLKTRQNGPFISTRLLDPKIQKYIMKELKEQKKDRGARKKNRKLQTIKYVLGQGIDVDTPEEAADLLLKRDYPEIYNAMPAMLYGLTLRGAQRAENQ